MPRSRPEILALALSVAVFGLMLFKHLSYPLLWQDEAETAVFATRILEYGYPKVHGPRNVVYEFGTNVALGIDERLDAYIGTTWGHFYFAVPGTWWARGTEDLYAKTARIRLPFALVGALGTALFALAVLPTFRKTPRRALRFAALFMLCSAVSVSLVLHLREARYYPLLVALIGAILFTHLRYAVYRTLEFRRYAVALALLLVALFNVFFSAYFIVAALLGVEALWRGVRAGEPRARQVLRALLPLIVSAVCVAPLLVYFETFQIAAEFSSTLGLTPGVYLQNLGRLTIHFARYEFLVPALAVHAARVFWDRRGGDLDAGQREGRRVVRTLGGFALGYAAIGCINPLVYERYFVVLSPVVTLIFLLDAFSLAERVKATVAVRNRPRAWAALGAGILAVAALSSGSRVDAVAGRLREIAEPYRGPVDFAIGYLRDRYPNPSDLVIATNYENHPYMYYLGSHVIVGFSRSNIRADRLLDPDVVIPRRRWRSTLAEVRGFLERGRYRMEALEVRDLHYNNVPALSVAPSTPDPHHFDTARPERPAQRLEIYTRIEP